MVKDDGGEGRRQVADFMGCVQLALSCDEARGSCNLRPNWSHKPETES